MELQRTCTERLAYYLDQPAAIELLREIQGDSKNELARKLATSLVSVADKVDYGKGRTLEGARILRLVA